ncbi:hypothetical protein DMC25_26040 [Caulobacter sp. D4A]|nr:hypothetical protein DMC25_26040 [Caulobacter sp. D4A]PXA95897.1 hypothetical protein DMC18_03130 [Caulobacter sp. D5]
MITAGAASAWLLAAGARAQDPTGRWVRAESPHFVVYSADGEREAREYALMLEDFDGVLRRFHGKQDAPAGRKLPVYLVRDNDQLQKVFPGADRAAGLYSASLQEIFIIAVKGIGDYSTLDLTVGDNVVLHEYVHHFVMQYFPDGYPAWLSEGLPEYYSTIDLKPKRVFVGGPNNLRAFSLRQRAWLPADKLLGSNRRQIDEQSVGVFYGQAWLLTHYVWSNAERRQKLGAYLDRYRDGQDAMQAWTAVYGDDAKGLENKLKSYMNTRLMGVEMTRDGPPTPPVTVTAMPAGADDLLLDVQLLKRQMVNDKDKQLERVRTQAAKRPNERFSRLALARAETQFGDRDAGEAMLERLLAEKPDDLEALQLAAFSRLYRAEKKSPDAVAQMTQASVYLGRANKLDPDNYLTLYGYFRAQRGAGKPTENTLNVLARAVELAPQQASIRMTAGQTFMEAGHYDEARFFLEPAANNPHGGGLAAAAQKLIDQIDAKEAAAAAKPAAKTS